ncbi:MAG: hypothetical protein P1P65_09380 [Treponema sp.]
MRKFFYMLILCSLAGFLSAQAADTVPPQTDVEASSAVEQVVPEAGASVPDTLLSPPDSADASAAPAGQESLSGELDPPAAGIEQVPVQSSVPSEQVSSSVVVIEDEPAVTHDKLYAFQTAEMNEPTSRTKRRPLSMHSGLKLSVLAANNLVSVPQFFGHKLVIDLNKLAKKTIRSGMHIGALIDFDWFFQFTVLEEHTIKFSTTVDGRIWGNASKALLDLIAKGNPDGKPIKGTYNASINIFADTGIMYQLTKPSYSFAARLAYFVPVAYMRNPQASYSLSNDSATGTSKIRFEGEANIYGHLVGLSTNSNLDIAQLFKDGGLDISLYGSYQPAGWVTVTGGIDYLPLMVVTMNKGVRNYFLFEGSSSNVLDALSKNKTPFDSHSQQELMSADLPAIKIMRPCKLRIGADFKPLMNNYLILSPSFAIPVVNAKPFYMDGGLKIESRFAKDVLGVSLETGCIERMWRHELAFFIDSRFATFTLAASVASHDFARTFTTLSGAGFRFGIGIGF